MANTFEMICKLKPCRQTEKFTPIETKKFESGWTSHNVRFNAVSGMNRVMLEVRGGAWSDPAKNEVRTYKRVGQANEKVTIPWRDRMKPECIEDVVEYRKFVIDLGDRARRKDLRAILAAFDNGTVTDEMMANSGVSAEAEAKKQLAAIDANRQVFITEWDFSNAVEDLLGRGDLDNMTFLVRGNIELSEYNGRVITRYAPTRIFLAKDSDIPRCEGSMVVVYGANALDGMDRETTHNYYVNAYVFSYDSRRKKQVPIPVKFVMPDGTGMSDKDKGLLYSVCNNFTINKTDGVAYKELGVKFDIIDGAEAIPLTRDMLTENELELLSLGAVTMEDIQRDRGGIVYGERKREWRIKGFAKGWMSGAKPTVYTEENMTIINEDEDDI